MIFSTTKLCINCNHKKNLEDFGKNKRETGGLHYYCKECVRNIRCLNKEKNPDYFKQYAESNRAKLANYQKEYRKVQAVQRLTELKNTPTDKIQNKTQQEQETKKNIERKEERRRYFKNKYAKDEQFRLKKQFESKLNRLFKDNNDTEKAKELIGCTMTEFKAYLEPKFLPTMTWDNYGTEWSFDRITPFCDFDLTDDEQARLCFHYSNVQPLFIRTKIIDGSEYVGNSNKNRF